MAEWTCAYRDRGSGEALFLRDEDHYADVVEVTDLDSATGTNGMLLVEYGNVSIEHAGGLAEQRERFRHAWEACGPSQLLTGMSRARARGEAYRALWAYGHRDVERSEVLAIGDAPRHQDGWEATVTLAAEDELPAFLEREFDIAVELDR